MNPRNSSCSKQEKYQWERVVVSSSTCCDLARVLCNVSHNAVRQTLAACSKNYHKGNRIIPLFPARQCVAGAGQCLAGVSERRFSRPTNPTIALFRPETKLRYNGRKRIAATLTETSEKCNNACTMITDARKNELQVCHRIIRDWPNIR